MFALLPSLVSVLAAVGVSEARPGQPQQQPEQAAPPPPRVFSSTERIHTLASSVSPDYHTTFKHPSFPGHGLRIKETTGWCEPKARCVAVGTSREGKLESRELNPLPRCLQVLHGLHRHGRPRPEPLLLLLREPFQPS